MLLGRLSVNWRTLGNYLVLDMRMWGTIPK